MRRRLRPVAVGTACGTPIAALLGMRSDWLFTLFSILVLGSFAFLACGLEEELGDRDIDSNGETPVAEAEPGEDSPSADEPAPADPNRDPDFIDGSPMDDPDVLAVLRLPSQPYNYANPELPAHFRTPVVAGRDNTPAANEVTDAGATLGRVLFYDTLLSRNESKACASCHLASDGFSDPDRLSEGFEGSLTARNSMPIANLRYYGPGAMFWDERSSSVEEQVLMPIQDIVEMGLTLSELEDRLRAEAYYPPLFEAAFGDDVISSERVADALAQFVRSILSFESRYDQGLLAADMNPGAPFSNFTDEENRGKALFLQPPNQGGANCAVCHLPALAPPGPGQPRNLALFWMEEARNNGLSDGSDPNQDLGLGAVTGRPQDEGKFKSPTLRNVALTSPYMHDGSLETLSDVVRHYARGIEPHPNLDPRLRGPAGQVQRLNLSNEDIAAVVAFLGTLTDRSPLEDERFSDPFMR